MYATAATKAGPRNGTSARSPRVSPLRAFSAARSTRSSPGSATTTGSTGSLVAGGLVPGRFGPGGLVPGGLVITLGDENSARETEGDVHALAFDADHNRALVFAYGFDLYL